jgi:glutathione synthase/RimK-type ligase-like ATP-grasp enzyme
MAIEPEVLILSSRTDFGCDYVIAQLAALGRPYLRLNTEDLPSYEISFDPLRKELWCKIKHTNFLISSEILRSVWFRRSVYLRDSGSSVPSRADEQIARMQWAAFIRGLVVFDRAKWFNHPGATYLAEQKPLQLSVAKDIGFSVPQTLITNDATKARTFSSERLAVKGVDTIIAHESGQEVFAFTDILPKSQVGTENLRAFPATVQEAILPKIDLRVTVVGDAVFAASITRDGCEITGDWRSNKTGLCYARHSLPSSVERLCLKLIDRLGLRFGAIDLVQRSGDYFFLEINPTGEWAWLVDATGMKIDEAIARALTSS